MVGSRVKQGDIIKLDFSPQKGHEQAGYRPAVVVSNARAHSASNMVLVCPVTNTCKPHKTRVALGSGTETTGYVLCDHIRAVDLAARALIGL